MRCPRTLAVIPTGIAYAIWSGVGIVLISLVGWIVFNKRWMPRR